MYTVIICKITGNKIGIFRESDQSSIPINPDNADYQKYLQDVKDGITDDLGV